jgi:serine/threonine-protein kinase
MQKNMKKTMLTGLIVIFILGAVFLLGGLPLSLKVQQKVQKRLGITTIPEVLFSGIFGIRQNYADASVLDFPSKLHPKDHQAYLNELKKKYADAPPLPKMVRIPAGKFLMGCQNEPCSARMLPAHEVAISPFEMAATETTFEQWDTCVAMGGCYTMPGGLGFGRGSRPVMQVSWDDVTSQYIRWLNENSEGGYRLPSEAEWEYAARAGTVTKRYWGNEDPSCDADSPYAASWGGQPWWKTPKPCPTPGTTVPVASFAANPWGLYDMLGSVHEWSNDCENDKDYTGAPADGSAWREKVCSRIVVRGGAWTSDIGNMRLANRKVYVKESGFERVGFRIVRDLE